MDNQENNQAKPEYRIKKLIIRNHPYLDDMSIDLAKANGTPYTNIVFAGENGTGKTTLLNVINLLTKYHKQINNQSAQKLTMDICLGGNIQFTIIDISNGKEFELTNQENIYSTQNNRTANLNEQAMFLSGLNLTTLAIDTRDVIKENINASIVQLYEQAQSQALATQLLHLDDITPRHIQDNILTKLVSFLKHTFGLTLTPFLDGRKDGSNRPIVSIINPETKKPFSINSLSSGQKEILFRALYTLLKMSNSQTNIITIDEPELSMHPKWQEKVFKAYKLLFTSGQQKMQFFCATHSDHVLKSAFEDPDTLIVKLCKGAQPEQIKKGQAGIVLPKVTLAEIKWRVFDIETTDFHIELYGAVQSKENKEKIADMDKWLDTKYGVPKLNELNPVTFRGHTDLTLPTYIRNYIHHPNGGRDENCLKRIRESIGFLITLL